ncbi:hypothetical protein FRC12_013171 [Ceratobasidium sp. 428]|nr:hypothetical protein FRC12_013171 [Ceratobasidium sp. 428]
MPSTPSYLESSTQGVPSPASQSFSQGSSYSDNELLHLRSHSALELAALQAYFNLSAPSPQYPDFSAAPTSSSVDTVGTGIPSNTISSGSPMDLSVPMRREGSSDGSEGGTAYRLGP